MTTLEIILVFFLLVSMLAACAASTIGNGYFPANGNFGPATSVPQTYMTPDGDRVSRYAPYYYPDH